MALRNAFELMATEGTLRKLLDAMTFPKDVAGRQRVVVDGTVTTVTSAYWGNNNTAPTYYSTGAPTAIDAREAQRQASLTAGLISRQKWTY